MPHLACYEQTNVLAEIRVYSLKTWALSQEWFLVQVFLEKKFHVIYFFKRPDGEIIILLS